MKRRRNGWCWVCHKWGWFWQNMPTDIGVLSHHKKCDSEATKQRILYFEKNYGKVKEEVV